MKEMSFLCKSLLTPRVLGATVQAPENVCYVV
jgi:hypothetical protein